MKKFVFSAVALLFCCAAAVAQEKQQGKRTIDEYFYQSVEFAVSDGFKKEDLSVFDLGVRLGWRIDRNWALFVPADMSLILYHRTTTRNYSSDVLLGLGAARRFFLQSGDIIELSAQCNSTFAPTPVHYLKPSVMVRYSLNNRDNPRFYAGLGGQWIHPYRNLAPDRVLLTVSLGVWFL